MGLRFMSGMVMIMGPMIAGVSMVVPVGSATVGVLVEMFMQVLVAMSMDVFVAVNLDIMGMLMVVCVRVVVGVQMLVFVLSFHNSSSSVLFVRLPRPFMGRMLNL